MLAHAYLAVVRQHAIRGRGPRPRGRLAAPYGSRGAPAPLASRLGKAARSRSHPRLVGLATTTPAARQTITLDPQNQNSSTPAVVLVDRVSGAHFTVHWACPNGQRTCMFDWRTVVVSPQGHAKCHGARVAWRPRLPG